LVEILVDGDDRNGIGDTDNDDDADETHDVDMTVFEFPRFFDSERVEPLQLI
jgi:hypothetical protein